MIDRGRQKMYAQLQVNRLVTFWEIMMTSLKNLVSRKTGSKLIVKSSDKFNLKPVYFVNISNFSKKFHQNTQEPSYQ